MVLTNFCLNGEMNKIEKLYQRLLDKHGSPKGQWRLWCKRPKTSEEREEVMVGAVLTQNTNWNNAEQAIKNLKRKGSCSLKIFFKKKNKKDEIAELIKPSRFYNQKSEYLYNLSFFVIKNYGGIVGLKKEKLSVLRKKLISVRGLGKETTDSILLYALGKPIFVIDEYTKRFVGRHKITDKSSYQALQDFFESQLPRDHVLFQDFHALIVIEEQKR